MTMGTIRRKWKVLPWVLSLVTILLFYQIEHVIDIERQLRDYSRYVDRDAILPSIDDVRRAERALTIQDGTLPGSGERPNPANVTGFCSLLPPKTASTLWMDNVGLILNASRHPEDEKFRYWQGTRKLLATIRPSLLRKGYKTGASHVTWKRVLDKVHDCLLNDTAKPLQIAVLGGSVTGGAGCVPNNGLFFPSRLAPTISRRNCSWPFRLESFFNNIAGRRVVEVHNLAVGGTTTDLGTPIVKYWLYRNDSNLFPDGPDVIVNAYSTNEQFVIPFRANVYNDSSYQNEKRRVTQEFLRAALESRPCGAPPLVVTLDDYFGYFHDRLLGEMTYSRVTKELSEYYGTMMVSYADALRRHVYADTSETIFTAPWLNLTGNENKHDVHLQMSGHLAITYFLAFSVLSAIRDYCDDEEVPPMRSLFRQERPVWKRGVEELVEDPVPPELDEDLFLSNISAGWAFESTQRKALQEPCCSDPGYSQYPCAFSFLCGVGGTLQSPQELTAFLAPHLTQNTGWSARQERRDGGFFRKLGFVATEPNATFTLVLSDIAKSVRTVHLHTLKSYGPRWQDSRAKFKISVNDTWSTSFEIEGTHDDQTSVYYPFLLNLGGNEVPRGSNVKIKAELVGGKTFKILALMLCNR